MKTFLRSFVTSATLSLIGLVGAASASELDQRVDTLEARVTRLEARDSGIWTCAANCGGFGAGTCVISRQTNAVFGTGPTMEAAFEAMKGECEISRALFGAPTYNADGSCVVNPPVPGDVCRV